MMPIIARTVLAHTVIARLVLGLARTVAAELIKLWGLPAVLATAFGTVVVGVVLTAALGSSALSSSASPAADATHITTRAIVFLQVGPILLGVLAAATEHAGRQIVTTLTATPDRLRLLAGKTSAYLTVATATSVATVGAGATAVSIVFRVRGVHPVGDAGVGRLLGAAAYLVLAGLLALALAVLLRSLVAPLVTMLALVLIVSPLLSGYTEHARWLPDRAGSALYLSGSAPVLTPGAGMLVLLAWITVAAVAATTTFLRHDA